MTSGSAFRRCLLFQVYSYLIANSAPFPEPHSSPDHPWGKKKGCFTIWSQQGACWQTFHNQLLCSGWGRDSLICDCCWLSGCVWLISGNHHDVLEYRRGKKCSRRFSLAGTRWVVDSYFHIPHHAFVSGAFRPHVSSWSLSSLSRAPGRSFLFCIKASRQSREARPPKDRMPQPRMATQANPGSPRSHCPPPPYPPRLSWVAVKNSGEHHVSVP